MTEPEPSPAGAGLALAVEVGGSDDVEVVLARECPAAEVVAHLRGVHRASAELVEQHEHHPVNARSRLRPLVEYQLLTCDTYQFCFHLIVHRALLNTKFFLKKNLNLREEKIILNRGISNIYTTMNRDFLKEATLRSFSTEIRR